MPSDVCGYVTAELQAEVLDLGNNLSRISINQSIEYQ